MSTLVDSLSGQEEEKCEMCDCTFKQRIIGGVILSCIGALFSFLSFFPFSRKNYSSFSIMYVIGTAAAIGSTFFFAGLKKQIKELKTNRPFLCSAIAIVVCVILLLIVGNTVHSLILTLLILILQWTAQIFYYVTAFPGGWAAIKGIFGICCK